eukprot:6733689-Prymnesium_polylepis.1
MCTQPATQPATRSEEFTQTAAPEQSGQRGRWSRRLRATVQFRPFHSSFGRQCIAESSRTPQAGLAPAAAPAGPQARGSLSAGGQCTRGVHALAWPPRDCDELQGGTAATGDRARLVRGHVFKSIWCACSEWLLWRWGSRLGLGSVQSWHRLYRLWPKTGPISATTTAAPSAGGLAGGRTHVLCTDIACCHMRGTDPVSLVTCYFVV